MRKLIRVCQKIEDAVLELLLALMGLTLLSQVLFRYLLKVPLIWSEELARYLQVWLTFIGVGFGLRCRSHIAVTLLVAKFPPTARKICEIASHFVLLFSSIIVIPSMYQFAIYQKKILSSALRIPMNYIIISLLFCMITLSAYSLLKILQQMFSIHHVRGN